MLNRMLKMKELKPIDYKLMFELIKDSHRSDRQLAKALGISQPTVTRRRTMLENNYLEGYTVIPKFGHMGYELVTFTFMKSKVKYKKGAEKEAALNKMKEHFMKKPNVVLVTTGQGMGSDIVCISLHENYSDYANFVRENDSELADLMIESQSFHADLKPGVTIKPFHLKYLAKSK
jgi:DNA-binding Lrp family transcriptional regulator